jgi:beta-1,4-mannosyl-glycoprotein beta-1,4-N-acetylglucosaminyltransferase
MIYDCFIFNNELDLLDIRLHVLSSHVDYFVLVEATQTFSGQLKPLFYQVNQKRFTKFANQIIHVVVDDMNNAPTITNQPPFDKIELFQQNPIVWSKEFYQRNSLVRGLAKATDNDLILIGDIDEIPNPSKIKTIKFSSRPTIFEQKFYYYYLNCQSLNNWHGTRGIYKKFLTTPQEIRVQTLKTSYIIKNGGWHFSYLGGFSQITKKIKSFSHQELNIPQINNLKRLKFNIDNNLDIFDRPFSYNVIKVDKSFPKYIYQNTNKYKKYIKPIVKVDQNLQNLRQEIIANRQKISDQDYHKRCLQQQVTNLDNEKQILKQDILTTNQALNTIYKSKTWQIYLIYKKITNYFTH